jgi:hypothetical protein
MPILFIGLVVPKQEKNKKIIHRLLQDENVIYQEVEQPQNDPSEPVEASSPEVQKVRMRVVPVPRSLDYEPWSEDLIKWIKEKNSRSDALSLTSPK